MAISLLRFIGFFIGLILACRIHVISATECGTTDFTRRLISKGTTTERGEFPFLAAVYLVKQMEFICGGSLISAKHVLSAAHCFNAHEAITLLAGVIVYLGAHDLTSRNETGVVQRNVSEILVHPDWNTYLGNYDADLAILVLSETVLFTRYIRPVCMPPDDSVVAGVDGTIVGWGLTENGTQLHLQYPKQGMTNALNDSYCYITDYIVAALSSLRTFCGSGGYSSPNRGDSGGGFFVRYGSAWVQLGIVSAIRSNATGFVDPNSISLYTIVKEFKAWINDAVRQSGGEVGEAIGIKKIQLNCHYTYASDGRGYGCWVVGIDIRRENIEVASFTGSHQNGKTDEDVEMLIFENGTMFYVPDGIGNRFKNLKTVGIKESLNTKLIRRSNAKNWKGVVHLLIFDNDIETLEEDFLWDLPELEKCAILNNNLGEIEEKTFLYNLKLRVVYLESNKLKSIPANLFGKNFLLERIDLQNNLLKTIDGTILANNSMLKEINLYRNQLESIPGNLFRQNLLLETVRLSENNLRTIDGETFINNTKLREVYLFSNQLESIPANLFEKNFLLERIDLWQNSLKMIETTIFANNPNLTLVKLDSNQLETIPPNLFRQNFLLKRIDLDNNILKTIDGTIFANNSMLKEINLYRNQLESIPENLFRRNFLLETIRLNENKLKTIDEVAFLGSPYLKILILEKNQLESIPPNLFQNNFLLEKIDFSYNFIKTIDVDFTVFTNVRNIYLDGNLCIDGYYEGTEDPHTYLNQFRNLTEFQSIIRANCSSAKP